MRNYVKDREARGALMRGVHAVADAVRPSYGAKGKAAVLEVMEAPYSLVVDDGITIAERVKLDDPIEQMGANLIREAISRANKQSGDGSTTAAILTDAILEEGQKYADSNEDVKQQLFDCLPAVQKAIDDQTKPITPEEVHKVATVSCQDETLGKMIGEIFQKIGKDGVVDWDSSYSTETFYDVKDGVELKNVAPAAQWMMNYNSKGEVQNPYEADRAIIKNPKILITRDKINNIHELEPFLQALKQQGTQEMVIFFDEMEATVLQALAMTWLKGIFKVICLKAPTLWKDWIYEDFARMTGATIIGQDGATWKTPTLNYLGTCEKIVAYRHGTNVIGIKDLSEHIKTLEEASKKIPDLAVRVAWLNSKSAIIKIGGRSEVEISHKRYKIEDAVNSAKMALQNGVVVGGGYCLANAADNLPDTIGGQILKIALKAPLEQIKKNERGTMATEEELKAKDIWDAANIPKNAINAAISVAGTVLNCEVAIPLQRDIQQKYA